MSVKLRLHVSAVEPIKGSRALVRNGAEGDLRFKQGCHSREEGTGYSGEPLIRPG